MWLIVVLALAVYRVAHFIIDDNLIASPRIWLHTVILSKDREWRVKLHELITCYWCITIWISGFAVIAVDQFTTVPLPWLTWLAVAQGAMIIDRIVR